MHGVQFFESFLAVFLPPLPLFDFIIDESPLLLSLAFHVAFHFCDSDFQEIEFIVQFLVFWVLLTQFLIEFSLFSAVFMKNVPAFLVLLGGWRSILSIWLSLGVSAS